MQRGSKRYRQAMASLDQAGVTTNIVRIGPKHFELHQNYQIVKAARTRATCNRTLLKLTHSISSPSMFFQTLADIDPAAELTFKVMLRNGSMTVEINPATVDKMKAIRVTATPAELDAELIDALRVPLTAGKSVADQVADATKSADKKPADPVKSAEKPADKKPVLKTPPVEVPVIPPAADPKPEEEKAETPPVTSETPPAATTPAKPQPPRPGPPRPAGPPKPPGPAQTA